MHFNVITSLSGRHYNGGVYYLFGNWSWPLCPAKFIWIGVMIRPPSDFLLRTTILIMPSPLNTALITCFLSLLVRSTSFILSNQSFTLNRNKREYNNNEREANYDVLCKLTCIKNLIFWVLHTKFYKWKYENVFLFSK